MADFCSYKSGHIVSFNMAKTSTTGWLYLPAILFHVTLVQAFNSGNFRRWKRRTTTLWLIQFRGELEAMQFRGMDKPTNAFGRITEQRLKQRYLGSKFHWNFCWPKASPKQIDWMFVGWMSDWVVSSNLVRVVVQTSAIFGAGALV